MPEVNQEAAWIFAKRNFPFFSNYTIQMKITSALCALFLAMETFALPINMPKGRSILAPRLVNTKRDEAQDGIDELRIPKESIKCLVGSCKDN